MEDNNLLQGVVDQDQLEHQVIAGAEADRVQQDIKRDERLLQRLQRDEDRLRAKMDKMRSTMTSVQQAQFTQHKDAIKEIEQQRALIFERISLRDGQGVAPTTNSDSKEDLVRAGKSTPFDNQDSLDHRPVKTVFPEYNTMQPDVGAEDDEDEQAVKVVSKRKRRVVESSGDEDESDDASSSEEGDQELQEEEYQDDASFNRYRERMMHWVLTRRCQRDPQNCRMDDRLTDEQVEEECHRESPGEPDATVLGTLNVPGEIYSRLFEYQRTSLQWMFELHQYSVGGIMGDEMGLGKSVQIIAFLAALWYSRMMDKPALIVCPATVMKQWCKMLHEWWPMFRVIILHSSSMPAQQNGGVQRVVDKFWQDGGHIVITTYEGVRAHRKALLFRSWSYVILDEGHKIRNPEADISQLCKQFNTARRMILSGTPIQNNLTELWSLFDFVYPGRLGTLQVFQSQFDIPIRQGGYSNASPMQVHTAYKCATILRDLISPYLLRRMKIDVASSMPKKSEKVLFVKLTAVQRRIYQDFIDSNEMESILEGKRHVLYGIDILRKVCNHPDLLLGQDDEQVMQSRSYGKVQNSGKMVVTRQLLRMWKDGGHKVLLFTQTQQMQRIMERMLDTEEYKYLVLNGQVPIKDRMARVDKFNSDPRVFLFLLTTKVGGLGLNLIGADRVLIFDPDWNPSTDMQARERAWRLGQTREVTIFRLMTAGTIEEKVYHRQIFKQYLTNKILKDPKQRRFFKSNDLYDLFSLAPEDSKANETRDLFDSAGHDVGEDRVDGVAKMGDLDQADGTDKKNLSGTEDVMRSLFNMDELHTVVRHDLVMDSTRPDLAIMQREAGKIADQAVKQLQQSSAQVVTPVATSSSAILQNLRNGGGGTAPVSTAATGNGDTAQLLRQLIEYLKARRDNRAKSELIIEHFQDQLRDDQVAVFRQLLKQVATLSKSGELRGTWTLKNEYQ